MKEKLAMRILVIVTVLLAIGLAPAAAQEPPEPPNDPSGAKEAPKGKSPPAPDDPPKPKKVPKPEKPVTVVVPFGGDLTPDEKPVDPKKLLREIASDMGAVEAILLKAGDDPAAAESAQAAVKKLEKLLGEARGLQSSCIQQLDRLIDEVRKHEKQKQSKNRGKRTKPQRPDREDPKKDPRFDNRSDQPKDQPQRKRDPGRKEKTDRKPPPGEKGKANHPDKAGIWGMLPDKVFQLITNREQTVLPAEFREYIEEYFKRLAETKKQP